jgi:hypothetical protein
MRCARTAQGTTPPCRRTNVDTARRTNNGCVERGSLHAQLIPGSRTPYPNSRPGTPRAASNCAHSRSMCIVRLGTTSSRQGLRERAAAEARPRNGTSRKRRPGLRLPASPDERDRRLEPGPETSLVRESRPGLGSTSGQRITRPGPGRVHHCMCVVGAAERARGLLSSSIARLLWPVEAGSVVVLAWSISMRLRTPLRDHVTQTPVAKLFLDPSSRCAAVRRGLRRPSTTFAFLTIVKSQFGMIRSRTWGNARPSLTFFPLASVYRRPLGWHDRGWIFRVRFMENPCHSKVAGHARSLSRIMSLACACSEQS